MAIKESELGEVLVISSTGYFRVLVGGVSKKILKENINWEIEQIIGLGDTLATKATIEYVDSKSMAQYPIVTVTNYSALLALTDPQEDTIYVLMNEETIDEVVYAKYGKYMYSGSFFSIDSLLQPKCPTDNKVYVAKNGSWVTTYQVLPYSFGLIPGNQASDYSYTINHNLGFSSTQLYATDVYQLSDDLAGNMEKANVTIQHVKNSSGKVNQTVIYFSEPIPHHAMLKLLLITN